MAAAARRCALGALLAALALLAVGARGAEDPKACASPFGPLACRAPEVEATLRRVLEGVNAKLDVAHGERVDMLVLLEPADPNASKDDAVHLIGAGGRANAGASLLELASGESSRLVLAAARRHAQSTQQKLVNAMEDFVLKGEAGQLRPMWAVNALGLTGSTRVARFLETQARVRAVLVGPEAREAENSIKLLQHQLRAIDV